MTENKSGIPDQFKFDAEIKKFDEDKQIVYGWASVAIDKNGTEVIDRQGDIIDLEALEDASHLFSLHFRKSGVNHKGDAIGTLVSSIVFTPQIMEVLELQKGSLPYGWFVGFHIEDENVWKAIKEQKLVAFSIQGRAIKEDV